MLGGVDSWMPTGQGGRGGKRIHVFFSDNGQPATDYDTGQANLYDEMSKKYGRPVSRIGYIPTADAMDEMTRKKLEFVEQANIDAWQKKIDSAKNKFVPWGKRAEDLLPAKYKLVDGVVKLNLSGYDDQPTQQKGTAANKTTDDYLK
jgi:hypothetical protein